MPEDKKKKTFTLDQETQYRQAVLSESILVYNINLTKNLIEDEIYSNLYGKQEPVLASMGVPNPCNFDQFSKKWADRYVTEETRKLFTETMNQDFLISCWELDQYEITFEFCCKFGCDDVRYMRQNFFLIQEHVSGDIIAQTNVKDITAQKEKEHRMRRYQQLFMNAVSDYTNFLQINLETGQTHRMKICNNELKWQDKGNWMHYFTRFMKSICPSDVERVSNVLHPDALLAMENGQREVVSYRGLLENKDMEPNYYTSNVCRTTIDEQRYITIFSIDNTATVRNERKQKQLIEDALVRAEQASKAKTNFLNSMSHDIRTPMNAIIGFTALAMTHIDHEGRVKDYLSKIMSSGNHLLSLINDILDMSRIESGRIHLNETECNLSEVMHEVRNIIQADLAARKLDFYIDTVDVFDEDVLCDKLRLRQVLLNLLGNALKFTEPGGYISVRMIEKNEPSKNVANYEIRVKDTGIGMSKEFVKHIFEPFEREETSTNSGIQGTGLGMSITKNIVDLMGGTIEIQSEKGKGSEFIVTLPMKKQTSARKEVEVKELLGARALVVDDDFNTCDSVTNMLMQIGMRSEWTMSGKEAVLRTAQAVRRNDPYAVYIIDWMMPDMNGVEVTRNIRMEVGDDIPIIILTAYDWAEIEEEALDAGVTAFCPKPIFLSDLRRCLVQTIRSEEDEKEAEAEQEKSHEGKKILLVEDNKLNQEIAVEILQEQGFLVEVADNGAKAVDVVRQSKAGEIDTVLMDIQMPVMDGYEATKEIRNLANKELANISIIAMTANAFEEDRKKAKEAGMDAYLPKPIDIPLLFETLKQVGI